MRKNIWLPVAFIIFVSLYSCNKEPDNIVNSSVEPPPGNFVDTASLETLTLTLNSYIPTWKQLEKFTNDAQRLSTPSFITRALAGPVGWGTDINIKKTMDYFDGIHDTWNDDFSCVGYQLLPPYVDEDSAGAHELIFPLSGNILDKKLRAATVVFLREKSLGRPTVFVNFYPPSQESPDFSSEGSVLQWLENEFIPEKIAEAKAAELMKAECFIAWPLEFELFIKNLGGLYNGGFLDNYSNEQILAFANNVKNRVRDEVKKYYHGKLVAHSYWNYSALDSMWDDFDYQGFDEIHFAFFPQFDVETTARYVDMQLQHYTKIIQNSGNLPWMASEISVFDKYFTQTNLEEFEKEIYETVFSKLENAPIPPIGIAVAVNEIKTSEAKNYVLNYFNSR